MKNFAMLFSGQGAQYPGMMKELFDSYPEARSVFDCADRVLGRSISGLCFEGTQEELNLTHNTQVCMLAADLAAGYTVASRSGMPQAVAGFSLGEYAALVFAGVLSMEDAFRIVQIRADSMQAAVPVGQGAMAALVGASADTVESLCAQVSGDYVIPANYNSLVQTVISGTKTGVDAVVKMAAEQGINAVPLAVSAPFHCKLMKPAADALEHEFHEITFNAPKIPVYMNVNGQSVSDPEEIKRLLILQAMSPVQWVATLQNMKQTGLSTFVECGAGRTLCGLVRKTLKGAKTCRAENISTLNDTWEVLLNDI